MKNQVQLIAYVDRLSGGGFRTLLELFEGPLKALFGGIHLLPFFYPIDGADAGFDPIDHARVDPKLGTWEDVRALADNVDVMADLIVNHISRRSPQFLDFEKRGDASPYAELFLTYERVFPGGASKADLKHIYRPRPGLPFTTIPLSDGSERQFWTTFTPEQIDINVRHPQGTQYLDQVLDQFQAVGLRMIRLDAAGYAIKKPGSRCFMIPETFDFIGGLAEKARVRGIEVLVEIHSYYQEQIDIAKHVDRVYDFALPPLVLHAIYAADAGPLKQWLAVSPRKAVTVLDTHDGIGVIDVGPERSPQQERPGLLTPDQIDTLVENIHQRSNGESRLATGAAASNLDLYQVNCTFYDALGRRDDEYLLARAIQFFVPGIPQVYYAGLLAETNDMDLLSRTGVGRDINRPYYQPGQAQRQLAKPVVRALLDLIRFRNSHPAFDGEFVLHTTTNHELALEWKSASSWARLEADFLTCKAQILCSGPPALQKIVLGVGDSHDRA